MEVKGFSMKRLPLLLTSVLMIILFTIAGCTSAGIVNSDTEPNAVSNNDVTSDSAVVSLPSDFGVEEAAVSAVADEAVASMPRGQGGGGGYYYGEGGPLSTAELTVNADLPTVDSANVYKLPDPNMPGGNRQLLLDTARLLGIDGPLYFEWYVGLPTRAADAQQPLTYHIFDGQQRVGSYAAFEMYYENRAIPSEEYNQMPLPFAERARIAEQFLTEKGLLTGAYDIVMGWGHEVQFRTEQDGIALTSPTLTVQVLPSGEVGNVYMRTFGTPELSETATLRSAESALAYLRENMQDGQLWYNIIPTNPDYYRSMYSQNDAKTHWERTALSEGESTIVSWVQVYRAADGSLPPRIVTDRNIVLAADAAMLEEIANATVNGNNLRLTGVIEGEPGSQTMALSAWEPVVNPSELYLNGTYRVADGQSWLELPGGFRIKMNDAPADLPADSPVAVLTYAVVTDEDGCGAVLDWVYVDLMSQQPYVEEPMEDPYINVSDVTIDTIELAYQFLYPGEFLPSTFQPYSNDQNAHLVPMWRFAGETNKGDLIEMFIPALDSVELPSS
jgi:hypothetical protein